MNKKKFRNGFFCFVKLHKKVNENYENYVLLILDIKIVKWYYVSKYIYKCIYK